MKIIKPKHIFNKTYRIILTTLFQKVNSMSTIYLSGSSEWIFSNVFLKKKKDRINFHSYYSKGFRPLLSSCRVAFSDMYLQYKYIIVPTLKKHPIIYTTCIVRVYCIVRLRCVLIQNSKIYSFGLGVTPTTAAVHISGCSDRSQSYALLIVCMTP